MSESEPTPTPEAPKTPAKPAAGAKPAVAPKPPKPSERPKPPKHSAKPKPKPKPPVPFKPAATPAAATPTEMPPPLPPKRSSEEIRRDIEGQRIELGQSVDVLRDKVTELTDWRGQIRKHRRELVTGAAIAGFVIGGALALRRRR